MLETVCVDDGASDVRDKYVRDQGMFVVTKLNFTVGDNFVF